MAIKGLSDLLKKHKETELTAEQFEEELNKLLPETHVPKNVFNELNEKYKLAEAQKAESDKLLKEANEAKNASEEFRAKYDELLKTQKADKEKYEADIATAKKNNGIDLALVKAGARNAKAVRALLDLDKITLSDKGEVVGISDQLEAIKKDNDYLFTATEAKQETNKPNFGNPAPNGQKEAGTDALRRAFGL
jgi:hypothetical protein